MNYINDNMRVEGYVEASEFKTITPTGDKVLMDNGLSFNINRLGNYLGTCDTAAGTANKIVVLDEDTGFALESGVRLTVDFTNGNTASGTVTISTDNGVTYKPLYYYDGTAVSGSMAAGTYSLVFYNNTWVMLNGSTSSGSSGLADVVYNTNTKALQKTVGGATTDIVTTADLLYKYGEVRMHEPVYVNSASLSTLGSLDALFIEDCPAIFLKDEPLYDTIIVTPFSDTNIVLDFSNITAYADSIDKGLSLNRIHIYIMYSKTGLTVRGAVVNNPLTVSGSHSDPGVVMDNTCKLECYFNIDYGYWFVEVTSMGFVAGSKLSLSDYNEIIEVK